MRTRLALVTLFFATACGLAAWTHWTAGIPPTWSVFGRYADANVLVSEVREETGEDGAARRIAHVEVAWPPDSGQSRPLRGVMPHHIPRHIWTPEEVVGLYHPGEPVTVRVIGGTPFASRTDVTEMSYAVFFTLLALLGVGAAAALVFRRPQPPKPEEELA